MWFRLIEIKSWIVGLIETDILHLQIRELSSKRA